MAINATTSAHLRDYEVQLRTLDSDDISIPNQSLILDYFCTDHELTVFLRDEVFLESSLRHTTWRKVNQRAGNESKRINNDELSLLLDSGKNLSSRVWADIVWLTACRQENKEIADYIEEYSNYWRSTNGGFEQLSEEPVRDSKAETIASNAQTLNLNTSSQTLSNVDSHSQAQQTQINSAPNGIGSNGLAFFVVSLTALLGIIGMAISTSNYETDSRNQENTSSIPKAIDSSTTVQRLSDLETEQKGAVLMCEHQPIVEKVKSLNLVDPQNISRRDALIASSDRQISFLNQDSAKGYKYWEDASCTWGQQWFDNDDDDNFKLFLAISRKCPSPTLNYTLAKDKDRKEILSKGVYNAYGHSVGEIKIPYPQESAYIFIDEVSCS